jgi:hypothetical protein
MHFQRGMEPQLSPLSTFTRLVNILPPRMLEEEAGRSVASRDILRRQAMMVA